MEDSLFFVGLAWECHSYPTRHQTCQIQIPEAEGIIGPSFFAQTKRGFWISDRWAASAFTLHAAHRQCNRVFNNTTPPAYLPICPSSQNLPFICQNYFISTNTKLTQHSRYSSFTEQVDSFDRNLIFCLCNIYKDYMRLFHCPIRI